MSYLCAFYAVYGYDNLKLTDC